MATTSMDKGITWSSSKAMFKQKGSFLRNPPILSEDGSTWILPMYFTPNGMSGVSTQYSVIVSSHDGGRSWQKPTTVAKRVSSNVYALFFGCMSSPSRFLRTPLFLFLFNS